MKTAAVSGTEIQAYALYLFWKGLTKNHQEDLKQMKAIQKFIKKNEKAMGIIVHYLPGWLLVRIIFGIAFPIMVGKKEYKKFKGKEIAFQFTFNGMPGKKSWVLEIKDGKARITSGIKDYPKMIINASARDFIDFATGYLSMMTAIQSGRIGINGGPAMQMKVIMDLF
jgi:putative sterol carrier protein